MRAIVMGLGAIGGGVAAALARSGADVVGFGRGQGLAAIQRDGLTVRTPDETFTARFPAFGAPSELQFRDGDVLLLAVKSQDTETALDQVRKAGGGDLPVFCFQNGVAGEAIALRRFENVHGVTVMMPASYTIPGEVAIFGTPCHAIFDIGRYPSGSDAVDHAVADLLTGANMASFVTDDVMASKHGKLLVNLRNVIEAALGRGADMGDLPDRVRAEAKEVLSTLGIPWTDVGMDDPRRDEFLRPGTVPGVARQGNSTVQSLLRGTGRLETDYLNGEIAWLARRHGLNAPLNSGLARLAVDIAEVAPGSLTLNELEARLLRRSGR